MSRLSSMITRAAGRTIELWRSLSLAVEFAIAASVVVCSGMTVLGAWVSSQIEDGVVQNTAVSTAFYMESLISPLLQPLAREPLLPLPLTIHDALDNVLSETPLGRQIVTIKIWAPPPRRPALAAVVLYSNHRQLTGKSFPQTAPLRKASSGLIVRELNELDDAGNEAERALGIPLLEVYSPIYAHGTKRVIAVAEFYMKVDTFRADIHKIRVLTSVVVGCSTLVMLALLFGIVAKGSRTILTQRLALEERVEQLSQSLAHNEELREQIDNSRRRSTETTERLLRRIGADLHDGPAQLIGLALLRLDSVSPDDDSADLESRWESFETVRSALKESLEEIRNLSAGIAPPELEGVSLGRALELASRNHEKRTGTVVERTIDEFPASVPPMLKTCLYRFTQEGLNNAFKHADGLGQQVNAKFHGRSIAVEVVDAGVGLMSGNKPGTLGLGLAGLRDRVETLGGSFEISSIPGHGTRLLAHFELNEECAAHV